jgi:hypothetical protein
MAPSGNSIAFPSENLDARATAPEARCAERGAVAAVRPHGAAGRQPPGRRGYASRRAPVGGLPRGQKRLGSEVTAPVKCIGARPGVLESP